MGWDSDELSQLGLDRSNTALALITAATVSIGTVSLLSQISTPLKTRVEVPVVVGLSLEQAQARIESAGLRIQIGKRVADPVVAENAVARQAPPAGQIVQAGATIAVVLSLGMRNNAVAGRTRRLSRTTPAPDAAGRLAPSASTLVIVPKVEGVSIHSARAQIDAAGLSVGRIGFRSDEDRMPGTVLDQQPKAGSRIPQGGAVDLVVNPR
jgi:beta-lactam-binding protein with PASTA domain